MRRPWKIRSGCCGRRRASPRRTWPADVGCPGQTINAIENNKYDPTLSLAFRLARELGVTVDGLFTPGE